jgi:hypothetical protein
VGKVIVVCLRKRAWVQKGAGSQGPMVSGNRWVVLIPFKLVRLFDVRLNALEPGMEMVLRCGVGGDEVPSLLRSILDRLVVVKFC